MFITYCPLLLSIPVGFYLERSKTIQIQVSLGGRWVFHFFKVFFVLRIVLDLQKEKLQRVAKKAPCYPAPSFPRY